MSNHQEKEWSDNIHDILQEKIAGYVVYESRIAEKRLIMGLAKAEKMLNLLLEDEITKAEERGRREERQFVLNVLDGIDIADEQMQNKGGGTKAIRFALQSRFIDLNSPQEK